MRWLAALAMLLSPLVTRAQLPPLAPPGGVPVTAERVELGRKLFFDPRLSADNSTSCATCHQPARGFSDGRPVAVGIGGRVGNRRTPTVLMAAYSPLQFWDGRVIGTEIQSLQPLVNPLEMGNRSQQQVVNRVASIGGYRALFAAAYGQRPTRENFAHAIASFETTLLSFDAPIDRRLAGYRYALSSEAEHGYQVALRSRCFECHTPPLFTDLRFHNTGAAVATGTLDAGRGGFLGGQATAADVRAFKTPTLREVARRPPYTHAGRVPNLASVVALYSAGWSRDPNRDPRTGPLNLSPADQAALVTFLKEGMSSPSYPLVQAPALPR